MIRVLSNIWGVQAGFMCLVVVCFLRSIIFRIKQRTDVKEGICWNLAELGIDFFIGINARVLNYYALQ